MILRFTNFCYITIWFSVACICSETTSNNPIELDYTQIKECIENNLGFLPQICRAHIIDYVNEYEQPCMYTFLSTASNRKKSPYPGIVRDNIIPTIVKMRDIAGIITSYTPIEQHCSKIISNYYAKPSPFVQAIPNELSCMTTAFYQNNTWEFFGTNCGDIVAYNPEKDACKIASTKGSQAIITLKYTGAPHHILISYDEGGVICFFKLDNIEQEISCYKTLTPPHKCAYICSYNKQMLYTSSSEAFDVTSNGQELAFCTHYPSPNILYIYSIPEGIIRKKILISNTTSPRVLWYKANSYIIIHDSYSGKLRLINPKTEKTLQELKLGRLTDIAMEPLTDNIIRYYHASKSQFVRLKLIEDFFSKNTIKPIQVEPSSMESELLEHGRFMMSSPDERFLVTKSIFWEEISSTLKSARRKAHVTLLDAATGEFLHNIPITHGYSSNPHVSLHNFYYPIKIKVTTKPEKYNYVYAAVPLSQFQK